jgi:hypothetical protein
MGVGSAIGRTVAKQMSDVFEDYFLKSARAVEKSELGTNNPKPANQYVKQMRKSGVPEEEIADLGLDDLADTPMTKQEMLTELETRRNERTSGKVRVGTRETPTSREVAGTGKPYEPGTYESEEAALGFPQAGTAPREEGAVKGTGVSDVVKPEYAEYVPEVGNRSTYKELVYQKPEFALLDEAGKPSPIPGEHFTETGPSANQLFHLRMNTGLTDKGDKVSNLLELQSDTAQPIALGKSPEIPGMPFVNRGNWQMLGMKEAIKQAKRDGSRYLAIAPGNEIAMSVGNRQKTAIDTPVLIKKGSDGRYTFKTPDGVEIDPRPVLSDWSIANKQKDEFLDGVDFEAWGDLLEGIDGVRSFKLFGELSDLEGEAFLRESYWLMHKLAFMDQLEKINPGLAKEFGKTFNVSKNQAKLVGNLERGIPDAIETGRIDVPNWLDYQEYSLTEFLADMILPQKSIDLLENVDWDAASKIPANKFHPSMSKSEVGKLLDIDPKQVDEVIDAGQEFVLPAGEHGGQGIIDFYGTKLLTKKNLNKLDVPLVKIKVDRPDGTFVEVDALDLGGLPDDPKKIPYSLYAIALANVGGVGKAVTEMNAEQKQQQQTNNDNLQMAEGGFVNETDNLESMGNEPPVGALEEEVADNIDADLSEGEFVFPADVVRYVGLDKLMQIRQDAKQGLQRMSDMGQMSNADEATLPDDVPHEPIQLATGGVVTPTAAMNSMYKPSAFTQTAPIVQTGTPGTGAPVTTPTAATPAPATSSGYEIKRYADANGNAIYIPFLNGQPQIAIPEGYSETSRGISTKSKDTSSDTSAASSASPTANIGATDGGSDVADNIMSNIGANAATTTTTGGPSLPSMNDITNNVTDWAASKFGNNPVESIAREMAVNNPNLQANLDAYDKANVLGWTGAVLALATGIPFGSAALAKADKVKDAELNNMLNNMNPAVKDILTQPNVKDQFTNFGESFTAAQARGASDPLAAEIAVTQETNPFAADYTGNLGAMESSVASTSGTNVGTSQTAQLTNQELGLFNTVAEREAFLNPANAPATVDLAGTGFGSYGEADAVSNFGFGSDEHFAAIDAQFAALDSSAPSAPVSNANWADPDTGMTASQSAPVSNANWSDPDTGMTASGFGFGGANDGAAGMGGTGEGGYSFGGEGDE